LHGEAGDGVREGWWCYDRSKRCHGWKLKILFAKWSLNFYLIALSPCFSIFSATAPLFTFHII